MSLLSITACMQVWESGKDFAYTCMVTTFTKAARAQSFGTIKVVHVMVNQLLICRPTHPEKTPESRIVSTMHFQYITSLVLISRICLVMKMINDLPPSCKIGKLLTINSEFSLCGLNGA